MHVVSRSTLTAAALALLPCLALAQGDASKAVAGGGISIPGWQGKIDPGEAARGGKLEQAKLEMEGKNMHVVTGPAVSYWNPSNKGAGDYTVKAMFHEPKYQGLNDHPHPYGIFIGGNDMGTDQQSLLYCEAYGNGNFIVRGFGPAPFKMNGGGAPNAAVHKAAGVGSEVSQEIAMSVKGDKVSCSINGTEVWSAPKTDVVGAGKLKSTDGVYGFRFAHNTEGHVIGFTSTKP
ncbi:MAG TPA: hypothetical protein VI259_21790 [Gemmatimonadaceae bacterium]